MPSLAFLFRNASLRRVFLANLFLAFHTYLGLYVNSTYLKERLTDTEVSVAYLIAAGVSLASFVLVSGLLPKIGVRRTLLLLALIQAGALTTLALGVALGFVLVAFALYQTLVPLLLLGLDMYAEASVTDERGTGSMRGMLLTITNLALVLSPGIAGVLIGVTGGVHTVYLVAGAMLVPLVCLLAYSFEELPHVRHVPLVFGRTLRRVWADRNVFYIMLAHLNMRVFFSFMVIYFPLYLHEHVGFSWPEIGALLSIALIPYLVMELPAGRIADGFLGEKELLIAGFLVTGIGTALFALPIGASFLVWVLILLLSRVGASLIEIMTESYFFKHVNGNDADLVTFFRMTQPISYLVGPTLAALSLALFPYHALWYLLAGLLFLGAYCARFLVDTH